MRDRRPMERGFTLIEVMFAATILTMGLLFVLNNQMTALQGTQVGRQATEANALAWNTIERLRELDFDHDDLAAGDHPDPNNPVDHLGAAGGTYTRVWTVTLDGQMKRIAVKVSWASRGDHSIALNTAVVR